MVKIIAILILPLLFSGCVVIHDEVKIIGRDFYLVDPTTASPNCASHVSSDVGTQKSNP